jgi:hypothetical protein
MCKQTKVYFYTYNYLQEVQLIAKIWFIDYKQMIIVYSNVQ